MYEVVIFTLGLFYVTGFKGFMQNIHKAFLKFVVLFEDMKNLDAHVFLKFMTREVVLVGTHKVYFVSETSPGHTHFIKKHFCF